jgi:hypothetical protein
MHIAAAMGVKNQFVIETITLNKTVFPLTKNLRVIKNPAIQEDKLKYYQYDGRDIKLSKEEVELIMNKVTPNMVLKSINDYL